MKKGSNWGGANRPQRGRVQVQNVPEREEWQSILWLLDCSRCFGGRGMQSILCSLYRGGLRTFSCLFLLLGCMDKQQPPAPREAEPALNPLQSRREHYGLCVRVLASHTALPLWFYGVKHTALTTAVQLHFSWRACSHRTSFTRALEWKRKGARSGPLEVLLSCAARVPEKHIYLFITPRARIQGAWLAVFAWGVWRGCGSVFDDRKGVFAVCTPAGMWGKARWVQGLLYDVHACAGQRWKAERHERREIDEDNMWGGGLFQSQIRGAPVPVLPTLSLSQPVPPHTDFPCKQHWCGHSLQHRTPAGLGAQGEMWQCRQSGPCWFFCSCMAHFPLWVHRIQ